VTFNDCYQPTELHRKSHGRTLYIVTRDTTQFNSFIIFEVKVKSEASCLNHLNPRRNYIKYNWVDSRLSSYLTGKITPDDKSLFTSHNTGYLRKWCLKERVMLLEARFPGLTFSTVNKISFTYNGRYLLWIHFTEKQFYITKIFTESLFESQRVALQIRAAQYNPSFSYSPVLVCAYKDQYFIKTMSDVYVLGNDQALGRRLAMEEWVGGPVWPVGGGVYFIRGWGEVWF
jgi:hypothetical protein